MTLEMGLWRTNGKNLERLDSGGIDNESQLEDYIEADATLLGQQLLMLGRQVKTAHGGIIDLLAVDSEGVIHTIELKRDRTPRDVVAQALDYASWVATLGREDIVAIFETSRPGLAFDTAFVNAFGGDAPDELNAGQIITIVAASVDPSTERIVAFLNETFGVPINVVFFRHFTDGNASYLARTWLIPQEVASAAKPAGRSSRTRETWNGIDWYAAFGTEPQGRSWQDATRFGFVSAGGGEWYSRSLRNVPIGARIWVCIPKTGYVGVGTVTHTAVPFEDAVVVKDGVQTQLASLPLTGSYEHVAIEGQDTREWVLTVEWIHAVDASNAFWLAGMFANQNSACKLRHRFTLESVQEAFGVNDAL